MKLPQASQLFSCLVRARSRRGAVMVEAVAGMGLIIVCTVTSLGLLVNAGMSTYYKEKISFIANQTAQYAVSLGPGDDVQAKSEECAKGLLKALGLPSEGCKVKVELKTVADMNAISVTVLAQNLPLLANVQMLPTSIAMQDTGVALKRGVADTYLWMNYNPKLSGYLIPVVRIPGAGPQSLGLPVAVP